MAGNLLSLGCALPYPGGSLAGLARALPVRAMGMAQPRPLLMYVLGVCRPEKSAPSALLSTLCELSKASSISREA